MPDHTDNITLNKIVIDDQISGRRSWSCSGQTCSRFLIVFLSQFLVLFGLYAVAFGVYIWPRHVTNEQFGYESCAVQHDTFCHHQVH